MKLQINQDFTKLPRAGAFVRAAEAATGTARERPTVPVTPPSC